MAFVIPALLPLVVFWIYPILRSLYLSFTDWDYMSSEYSIIGFKNYISLFKDARFYEALWNTFIFGIGTVIPYDCRWRGTCVAFTESIQRRWHF